MINYDSILSAFDGKPTLLQWLKMVKKALDESVLKNVTIQKDGDNIAFTFNFEDGTSVTTPKVTLPKGDKGDKGDTGVGIVSVTYDHTDIIGDNTESYFKVTLSNGVENTFSVFAKNGSKGNDGVSITGINTVSNEVVGDKTLTTLRASYSDNTSDEFVVSAKNGKDGASDNLNLFHVRIGGSSYNESISFEVYTRKSSLNLEDALAFIPTISPDTDINSISANKILAYYETKNLSLGSVGVVKYLSDGNYHIKLIGIVYDQSTNSIQKNISDFIAYSMSAALIGGNL